MCVCVCKCVGVLVRKEIVSVFPWGDFVTAESGENLLADSGIDEEQCHDARKRLVRW